jgi:DNA polymerase-3 subunit epsilon
MSRAAIGEELGMGAEAVKALLRDGKFYAAPESDPARRQLAIEANEAWSKGMTKEQFRQTRSLTPPKAHECWKDADVLFERREG